MKWIKKLFGKKENSPAEAVEKEISIGELPAWLKAGYQKISEEISEDTVLIFRDLEASRLEIKESSEKLFGANVIGDFDVRAVKRAKSNRENVVKQVDILLEKTSVPNARDIQSLREFYENAAQNLDTCVENMARSIRYTGAVYPKEVKEITDSLGKYGTILRGLQGSLKAHSREIEAYERISESLKAFRALSASIEPEEREILQKREKIQTLESEIKKARQARETFEQSEEWKHYRTLETELADANSRVKKAEAVLAALVLPLSSNLSRLKKLHETGRYTLKPEILKQLDTCQENPTEADSAFFQELQKLFEDPALGLKAQKKEKALAQADTAARAFDARKNEWQETVQVLKEKKTELEKLDMGRLEELQQKETKLRDKSRLAGEELELSRKKKENLDAELEKEKEELREKVLLINNNVKLVFAE